MLRSIVSSVRNLGPGSSLNPWSSDAGHLLVPASSTFEQVRTVIKYSHRKGTRKYVKAAYERFYRLNCGLWIHAMPGRYRQLWRKTPEQIADMKKHVFCRKRHSEVLDKMFSPTMKKPSYLPDSPYEPYDNFKPPNLVYKTYK